MATRRKRSKKWIWWVVFVVLLIVAGVIVYFVWDGYFRDKGEKRNSGAADVTAVEDASKEQEKEVVVTTDGASEEAMEKKAATDAKMRDGGSEVVGDLTGVITYAGVLNGELVIRMNIDQYLSAGECSLALRNGGMNVYSATAEIVDSASTSTCAGFNVPIGNLPGGETQIVVYINSGDKMGEITGEVKL
ncbi:PLDc_N domain-containing protein [Candidatus Saccharibacteria bacterium]|nr:PLDc_N domain-containing protein [Candidatus Saccharibacteria bacterium]